MATSSATWFARGTAAGATAVPAAYAIGALLLVGEATVHVQQYFWLFHGVSWIGPLFLANAAACLVTIAGLAYPRTRALAALAGVVISAVALLSLVISYGTGCSAGRRSASARPSPSPRASRSARWSSSAPRSPLESRF